eukprot:COSAG01_NODE_3739_length_5746_cov_4.418984_7_plen_101_part_00
MPLWTLLLVRLVSLRVLLLTHLLLLLVILELIAKCSHKCCMPQKNPAGIRPPAAVGHHLLSQWVLLRMLLLLLHGLAAARSTRPTALDTADRYQGTLDQG